MLNSCGGNFCFWSAGAHPFKHQHLDQQVNHHSGTHKPLARGCKDILMVTASRGRAPLACSGGSRMHMAVR